MSRGQLWNVPPTCWKMQVKNRRKQFNFLQWCKSKESLHIQNSIFEFNSDFNFYKFLWPIWILSKCQQLKKLWQFCFSKWLYYIFWPPQCGKLRILMTQIFTWNLLVLEPKKLTFVRSSESEILKNWFHVKSEWQKYSKISTLHSLYV